MPSTYSNVDQLHQEPPPPSSSSQLVAAAAPQNSELSWNKFARQYRSLSISGQQQLPSAVEATAVVEEQQQPEVVNDQPLQYDVPMNLCVLMPNGTLVSLDMTPSVTFFEVKEEAFELSTKGPMYGALRDPKSYCFTYIDNTYGCSKEIDDEEVRLCDAQPFGGVLKLVEIKEDSASLELDEQIGRLIGKPLKDFDALRNAEVNEFRYKMRTQCEEIVKMRQNHSWLEKMKYAYPVAHEPNLEVPRYLLSRIPSDGYINIKVSFERPSLTVDLSVHHLVTPDEILTSTIRKLMCDPQYSAAYEQLLDECEADSYYDTSFETDNPSHLGTNYYLLKINGCLEYLLHNHKLVQYKTIRQLLLSSMPIHVVAIRKNTIEFEDESIYSVPDFLPAPRLRSQSTISLGSLTSVLLNAKRRHTTFSSWSIDRKLVIRIHSASRIVYGTDINRIAILVGIFHGGEMLAEHFMTTPISETASLGKSASNLVMLDTNLTSFTWDLDIVFNLKVSDLPRMARLCFSVVGFAGNGGSGKKLSKTLPVASKPSSKLFWGNINFFDYKGILRENSTTLSLWPHAEDDVCDDPGSGEAGEADQYTKYFNPLGTVVQNPATIECPLLTISFTKYSDGDNAIIKYPEMKEISRTYAPQVQLNAFAEEPSEDAVAVAADQEKTPPPSSTEDHQQPPDQLLPDKEDSSPELPNSEVASAAVPSPLRRSSSNAASIRSAWTRKQSLAIERVDVPEPKLRQSKTHASKQFMSKFDERPSTRVVMRRRRCTRTAVYCTDLETIEEEEVEFSVTQSPSESSSASSVPSGSSNLSKAKTKSSSSFLTTIQGWFRSSSSKPKATKTKTTTIPRLYRSNSLPSQSRPTSSSRSSSSFSLKSLRKVLFSSKQSHPLPPTPPPPPPLDLDDPSANRTFYLEQISDFCDRDLLYRMTDQECELLMLLREDCKRVLPNALNKLLLSFKWNQQKVVGQVLTLLQDWPKIPPSKALELLDYAYPDSFVRQYAIECLRDMTSDQLSHFLLQLVQALKYESYIYNSLVQFLLERAFENQRIGHQLFWLLRAEMHDPAVSVHFGLILEAYCRGAVDHVHILNKQMDCISKLRRINEIIRDDKSRDSREKKIVQMQDILTQKYYQETLSHVINPLDPAYKLGTLRTRKCKFMDSKMKPLWLVFENADKAASDVFLIFKNGDDLRQDMLTLQMIRIMDQMWKEEGLDLRMTPYKCVSLAKNVGLIEVVLNADTIANIQKEKGSALAAAFKKGSLFSWLKDNNPGEDALKSAIEEFTLSCAGYCVATYILGIADRHNDNIMVKRNGQLFHIDFGHILGKFKEKFGIRRERVPFVLTHDFVYVITHGGQDKNTEHFTRFQSCCEQAFLLIRRRGNFIISLFAMMLSTGIPEVSSVDDLQYLRETLVLDLSEEHARTHFRAKFTEALKNSWKTSFNWCAHSLAKDNRME